MTIDRRSGGGKYADVIDAADRLGRGDFGSASNALVVMVRQSELFKTTIAEIRSENGRDPQGRKTSQRAAV